jgi:hypothetical protein
MALSCPSPPPPLGPTAGEEDYFGLIDLECTTTKIMRNITNRGAADHLLLPPSPGQEDPNKILN